MKKKLRLKSLEVNSFVTGSDSLNSQTIKGGLLVRTGPGTILNTSPQACPSLVVNCGPVESVDIVCPPDDTLYLGCRSIPQCIRETVFLPNC